MAWRPVVVEVMEGYTHFPRDCFERHIETFYPLAVDLLSRDLGTDVRIALQALLRRIGELRMGMPPMSAVSGVTSPLSPTGAGAVSMMGGGSFPFHVGGGGGSGGGVSAINNGAVTTTTTAPSTPSTTAPTSPTSVSSPPASSTAAMTVPLGGNQVR